MNKLNNNIRTKQMRSFKLLTLIGILFLSTSLSAKDPCAPLGLPAEMKASKILFVMPTYVEYTTEVAMYALNMGVNINDKLMSEEERYQAFRDKKTKTIAKIFNQEYKIVTSICSSKTSWYFISVGKAAVLLHENEKSFG